MRSQVRAAIVADLLEEGWPSMDLMAEMLMAHPPPDESRLTQTLWRPAFNRRAPALMRSAGGAPSTVERILHRFWSYPRWIRRQEPADVYHIVDHSYAHLARHLPAGPVVVTCHDVDAFRTLTTPGARESTLPAWLVRRVLEGMRKAARVVCVSEVTRSELVRHEIVPKDRTLVVPNGVHPACSPSPDPAADATAAALTGPVGRADLLHVGSTIPRKRIDFLLEVLARVGQSRPDVRLWRVGGAFTGAQARRARDLGVDRRITVLPFVSRPVLAALYRRAALVLLPSEREGFGLPVVEAMACGTPILCSDLPVLREVGAAAATYCAIGDVDAWAERVSRMLDERDADVVRWADRRALGLSRAAEFSWARCAATMQDVYSELAEVAIR